MATRPIGFLRREEQKQQAEQVTVKNIEKEFKSMISQLDLDEEIFVKELAIEKKIMKELIKIYKQIRKLEQIITKRNKLAVQCSALITDYPKKSLQLLEEIGEMDYQIIPKADEIYKEISKHFLSDVSELYKGMELSKEQIKNIRSLANTLATTLSSSVSPIQESIQNQKLEFIRRSILARHPGLK